VIHLIGQGASAALTVVPARSKVGAWNRLHRLLLSVAARDGVNLVDPDGHCEW